MALGARVGRDRPGVLVRELGRRSGTRPSQPNPAAPDLNLLIAPAFAWMYQQTGDTTYRDRGDQIFAGGVKGAISTDGKQFNQNYMWSFDYVKWRQQ